MVTQFKNKKVTFSLKDIGSEIIDQLSSDIYSGPGPIMRELVKNAYDAYLGLDPDDLEDAFIDREIVISRGRNARGVGRLMVADRGMGLTLSELKAFVQISLCTKQEELENATGFRGLGSWAVLGGGSQIVITSRKKNHPYEARLIIDVRKIYKKMSPVTTLDDILNDPKCISFSERDAIGDSHGTTVEVVCDGEPEKVKRHELNRLYEYTDPADWTLREIIVQTCPLPFSSEGGAYKQVHDIYREVGYVPTHVSLDGDRLERGLPDDLPEPTVQDIMIGDKVAAKVWFTTSPKYTGEVRGIDEDRHNLGGSSIQLMKLNVPVGPKGIYSEDVVRATILNWYVGEVHITLPDVQPDASGQDLRAGTAREAFKEALQSFYKKLQEQAERKSEILSMVRKLRQGMDEAEALEEGAFTSQEKALKEAKVATAVKIIEDTSKRSKPKTAREEREREAAKDPQVEEIRREARQMLKEGGWLEIYGSAKPRPSAKSKKGGVKSNARTSSSNGKSEQTISFSVLQSRIARAVPRLAAIGLSQDQIEQVLEIINELIMAN